MLDRPTYTENDWLNRNKSKNRKKRTSGQSNNLFRMASVDVLSDVRLQRLKQQDDQAAPVQRPHAFRQQLSCTSAINDEVASLRRQAATARRPISPPPPRVAGLRPRPSSDYEEEEEEEEDEQPLHAKRFAVGGSTKSRSRRSIIRKERGKCQILSLSVDPHRNPCLIRTRLTHLSQRIF